MESTREITSYSEVNKKIHIDSLLGIYKNSLSRRYKTEEEIKNHDIYTTNEFALLANDSSFSEDETKIIEVLHDIKGNEVPSKLLNSIEQYFAKAHQNEKNNPKKLESSASIAKLRRTLAIIYKAAQIPNIELGIGGSKKVDGPIGVDSSNERPVTQQILDKIDSVWRWDGNLPSDIDTENWQPSKRRNFVLITPLSESDKPELKKEFDTLQELSEALMYPRYFPRVFQKTENAWYIESINGKIPSGTESDKVQDLINMAENLRELWKDAGVIFTDIKSQNFRKRKTGDTVIVDFGSRQIFDPNCESFYRYNSETTIIYTAPEIALQMQNADTVPTDSEKYIAYQLGILILQSFVPFDYISASVDDKKGFVWRMPLESRSLSIEVCSVSDNTFIDILRLHPELNIPMPIKQILIMLLNDNPSNRPTIEQTITTLKNTLSKLKTPA